MSCDQALAVGTAMTLVCTHVLVLEEFRRAKEQISSLLRRQAFSQIQQVDDAGKQGSAFSWTGVGLAEQARFLQYRAFVVVVGAQPTLLVLLK